jgi:hypothetical protein
VGTLASPVFADDFSGWRLGAALGQEEMQGRVQYRGYFDDVEPNRLSYSFFGGWGLNRYLAVEVGYKDGGLFNADIESNGAFPTRRVVQHTDSIAMVEVLTETVLSLQDAAPAGALAADLDDAVAYRAEIHQASGMVSVQLQVPVAEALLRIRAHAFADGRPLGAVAADIVARRLRLTNDRELPRGQG